MNILGIFIHFERIFFQSGKFQIFLKPSHREGFQEKKWNFPLRWVRWKIPLFCFLNPSPNQDESEVLLLSGVKTKRETKKNILGKHTLYICHPPHYALNHQHEHHLLNLTGFLRCHLQIPD